jgi:hypothetical protein
MGALVLNRVHAAKNAVCVLDVLADATARDLDEPVDLLEHFLHHLPAVRATTRRRVFSAD